MATIATSNNNNKSVTGAHQTIYLSCDQKIRTMYTIVACSVAILSIAGLSTTVEGASMSPLSEVTYPLQERPSKTQTPVIGVLAEVLRDYKRFTDKRHNHIVASYVKWVEMAGGQVLPIMLDQNDTYYEEVFRKTNGLLFPGGDNLLDPAKRTPMMVAARKLYNLAVEANNRGDYYPIWGTCLGKCLD